MIMADEKTEQPNPGSPEAVRLGCTCPVIDNHHGSGWRGNPDMFLQDGNCPIHNRPGRKVTCARSAAAPAPSSSKCPICGGYTFRTIYLGLPGHFCTSCNFLEGPAAYLPAITVTTDSGPMFSFFLYEGSYWKALWHWLSGKATKATRGDVASGGEPRRNAPPPLPPTGTGKI